VKPSFYAALMAGTVLFLGTSLAQAQTATSGSTSGSTAGASAGASAGALAGAAAFGGHNSSSIRTPRAPGAIGMAGLAASSGCLQSTSVGASFIGGGFGLGSTYQDQRCNAREDARLLAAFGYRAQALQLLIANSPMVAQAMGEGPVASPKLTSLQGSGGFQPVSLGGDEARYVNGVRQIYRGSTAALPERCTATLGLLQQQDTYLRGLVQGKGKIAYKQHQAALVGQNLRTGIGNVRVLCPAAVNQAMGEVEQRIDQIDAYLSTGRWNGPVG
jgi:hypothetical protein